MSAGLAGGSRGRFDERCPCMAATRTKGIKNYAVLTLFFRVCCLFLLSSSMHRVRGGFLERSTEVVSAMVNESYSKINAAKSSDGVRDAPSRGHNVANNLSAANLDGHFASLPFANGSNGAFSINGDIGSRESGEPIRGIVSKPDEDVGGEGVTPPRDPGRQLTDITGEAAARKLGIVSVRNGSLQRDGKKINEAKSPSLGTLLVGEIGKIVINPLKENENSLNENGKYGFNGREEIGSLKKYNEDFSQVTDSHRYILPLAIVSDDCDEMKPSFKNITRLFEDRDMESNEKDRNPFKKVSSLSTDHLLENHKGISHIHSYDKSRRDISDAQTKLQQFNQNFKKTINTSKLVNETQENVNIINIPFETEVKFKMDSNVSLFPWNRSESRSFENGVKRQQLKELAAGTYLNKGGDVRIHKGEENNKMINIESEIKNNFKTVLSSEGEEDKISVSVLNISKVQDKDEKWYAWHGREKDRDTVIRFSATQPREKYITPTLKLSEGTFVFRFLSGFFTFLHPFDFPTELLRDVMWNTLSVPQLILQSLRVEVGFILSIILGVTLALVVPAYGLCCALLQLIGGLSKEASSAGSPPQGALPEAGGGSCEKRLCLVAMQILVAFSFIGVGIMILGNESACSGAALARSLLTAAARDVPAYSRAAHQGLSHALMHSADQAIAAADHDLSRADVLLGEPIQKALAAETGVDVALDALNDISAVSMELSRKVSALATCGSRASALATAARERLRDLRRQADTARRHCASRDRPLCETADTSGIELVMHFDMVTEERLEPLTEVLNARNLTEAAESARNKFADIPKAVANQTSSIIEDIRQSLQMQRAELRVAERALSKAARHLAAEATSAARHIDDIVRTIDAVEFWRWLLFLFAVLLIILVMLLHILGICFGCCGMESHAGSILKTSVVAMCLFSVPLWLLAIVVFVAGGHGEVFLCRPLYDDPEFTVLSKLLDRPGLLYSDGSGFFEEVFKDLDNITINVPIHEILRECKRDRPAYPVFRLRAVLDMNAATAHYNWSALSGAAERLAERAPAPAASLAAPHATLELRTIMQAAGSVNFTDYRFQLNGPLTGKDLSSLADQFESIGNQITDLTTSSRIETLASRTRRLVINTMQPLDQLRTDLVFRLTELELQLQPFQRQMNQSLSHLKTIQYYIDNQGSIIAEKKSHEYVKRLTGYLEQFRGHVLNEVENNVAPCGPIWDIYDASRSLVCRHYMDYLNGFWFGLCGCLLVWMGAAPLALRLRRACRAARDRKEGLLLRTISHQEPNQSDHWR